MAAGIRSSRDNAQKPQETASFAGRKRIEQTAIGLLGRGTHGLHRFAPGEGERDSVGALIVLGALTHYQASVAHALDHFRQRRAIDAGDLDEFGLARAVMMFECGEQRELLLGQIARAGFALKKIAVILIAATQEMGRRDGKFKTAVAFSRSLERHEKHPGFFCSSRKAKNLVRAIRLNAIPNDAGLPDMRDKVPNGPI
ncbi:MAG: hypothetical protein WBQ17_05445 [Rhizomicrobium sp.]